MATSGAHIQLVDRLQVLILLAAPLDSAERLGYSPAREIVGLPTEWVPHGLGFLSCAGVATLPLAGLAQLSEGSHLACVATFPPAFWFLVFSSFCGSSSSRGSFLSRFFLVSILVNTSGARLNIFLSRNQKEIIERFGFEETKYERN